METWMNIISTVGFPIAAFFLMYVTLTDLLKQHKEEIDELRKSIDANTQLLIEIKAHFGGIGDDAEI